MKDAYERDETDEFITATTVGEEARIRPGDAVLAFNFRPDRMRQITTKLSEVVGDRYTTLTQYDEDWTFPVVFPPHRPAITLAKVIADAGLAQLHVAETEKYPHVTYFFNGGEEDPYPGEVRELAPSPRDVPTYDHKPEMSAREATEAFLRHWGEQDFAFAIINFANADMVGHTGVIPAAVTAVETVDECLGRIVEAVHAQGRRLHRHRRPRQRRRDARGGRLARHGALAQPRPVRRHGRGGVAATARASSPTSRRPRSRCSGSSSRSR